MIILDLKNYSLMIVIIQTFIGSSGLDLQS